MRFITLLRGAECKKPRVQASSRSAAPFLITLRLWQLGGLAEFSQIPRLSWRLAEQLLREMRRASTLSARLCDQRW